MNPATERSHGNERNVSLLSFSILLILVIFTLGRPSTLTPEDGDTRVGLSQS